MLQRHWGRVLLAGGLGLIFGPIELAEAQLAPVSKPAAKPASQPSASEVRILQALASYPETAPYRFTTAIAGGKVRISGRVGTKQIHDAAIQIALQTTSLIDDQIVIDTLVAHQVANAAMATQPIPGFSTPGSPVIRAGGGAAYRGIGGFPATYTAFSGVFGSAPYFYPQPLFGRLDEPFYGFEPPVISYPPWATAVRWNDGNANRQQPAPAVQPAPVGSQPSAGSDTVEMVLDAQGVATLRGSVPTTADKFAVAQKVSLLPGVNQVVNQITARDADAPPPLAPNNPPPAPVPAGQEDRPIPRQNALPLNDPDSPLDRRVGDAMARRPALANLPIKAPVRDGVAYLSGKVPTALEAMLAFRAAQQTPGVREVVDRLEFTVPDGQNKNPLIEVGRPDDVEPYLEAQIRRQVGDQAHIDRVRVAGNQLRIKGTVARAEDKPRVEAVLRSMALLRGFQLESEFLPE